MSEASTLNKLIILYTLKQVEHPLTNGMLTEMFSSQDYMDYLALQETLSELLTAELISSHKQSNRTEYKITDAGLQTLGYFGNRVSDSIKREIRQYLKDNAYQMRSEVAVRADYYRTTNKEYAVECRIVEGGVDLINLTIAVPTEVQAQSTIIKWKKHHQEIYASVMQQLL